MYTTYPLPAINTVDSHYGLLLVASICGIAAIIAILYKAFFDEPYDPMNLPAVLSVFGCIVTAAGIVSFTTGEVVSYKNTPVTAEFVGFQSEGWNQLSGKRRVDVHATYVIYRVPEGEIMLEAIPGHVYPSKAILYKN